jgi:tetratricopeptide (TPR) repeat protein
MEANSPLEKPVKQHPFKPNAVTYVLLALLIIPLFYILSDTPDKAAVNSGNGIQSPNDKPEIHPANDTTYFNLTAKNNPGFQTYFDLGYSYCLVKRFQQSIDATLKALSYNSQNALAWNNLCVCYNELHDWDKAIVAGKKALEIDPNCQLAKNNLNWAFQQKQLDTGKGSR